METDEVKAFLVQLIAPIQNELQHIRAELSILKDTFITRDELNEKMEEFNTQTSAELQTRDAKLAELCSQVEHLDHEISRAKESLPILEEPIQREQKKMVILGDSLIKWIDPARICPESSLLCFPGARISRIKKEVSKLATTTEVEHIVLVAGTNHIPDETPRTVASKLKGLLDHTKESFPNSTIYISSILPKVNADFMPGIQEINVQLNRICRKLSIDLIYNKQFFSDSAQLESLLARDKIHLSKRGVATLASNIRYRLKKHGNLELGSTARATAV